MRIQDMLHGQLKFSHDTLMQSMADVDDDVRHHRHDGATIESINHIFTHVVHSEDLLVQGAAREQATIWEAAGFAERTGILTGAADGDIYARIGACDPELLGEYAAAVFTATEEYAEQADDAEMGRVVDSFLGSQPSAAMLGTILWHSTVHNGEIAALKGTLGHKGLPF
jgi:uncharacterized damage-inducible protein DinB